MHRDGQDYKTILGGKVKKFIHHIIKIVRSSEEEESSMYINQIPRSWTIDKDIIQDYLRNSKFCITIDNF